MSDHIHTHSTRIRREDGTEYEAHVYGVERVGGTWAGWLEFHPLRGGGPILRTGQETSQPDRRALDYWAGGLEPVYIDGAFARARRSAESPAINAPPPRG
jgi:hypothetical protein